MLSLFSNLYKFSLPRISRSERTVRPLFTRFPDAEILRAIFPSFGKTPRRVAPFVVVVVVYDVQTLFFCNLSRAASWISLRIGVLGGKMGPDFYVFPGFDLVSAGESICLHANK